MVMDMVLCQRALAEYSTACTTWRGTERGQCALCLVETMQWLQSSGNAGLYRHEEERFGQGKGRAHVIKHMRGHMTQNCSGFQMPKHLPFKPVTP